MALSDYFEPFVKMIRAVRTDASVGGYETIADGEQFMCGCYENSTAVAKIANQQGEKNGYTIIFYPTISLAVGDRIKRLRDGKVLLITSDPNDKTAPVVASAMMQCRVCNAEVVE